MKRCSCGRTYTAAQWAALKLVGYHDDAPHGRLELRNCVCRSTMAVRVARLPRRARGRLRGPYPVATIPKKGTA